MLDNKVVLVGYSGHSFVVADTAIENKLDFIGYTDITKANFNPFHLEYLGTEREYSFFEKNKVTNFLIGIGDNKIREEIYNLILDNNREVLTLISKSANISKTVIM